jgi:hypothetical protein
VLGAVSLTALARASAGPAEQTGVFALLGGTPKIVSKFWAEHGTGPSATLKFRQFQLDGTTPILDYDVDMEKLAHVVVIRDDFATFAHLHPAFDTTTGTFSQSFTKEPNHRYYVYADTVPHAIGQQVFRFTMESDGPVATASLPHGASPTSVAAGPYTVTLSATQLAAGTPQRLDLTVLRDGHLASGLGTYLGAAAHAIFINVKTLAYVHVHPHVRGAGDETEMNMGASAAAGPRLRMALPALPAGTYALWVQFRGSNDRLYTAPFTISTR